MVQAYGPKVDDLRTKVRDLIRARADADGITVGEIELGIHDSLARLQQVVTGIFVLWPSDDITVGTTRIFDSHLSIPVLCIARAHLESDQQTSLGKLTSLIVDAIEADPFLGDLSAEAAVSNLADAEMLLDDPITVVQQVVITALAAR